MTCFVCDEAYHNLCHSPRVTLFKSNSKWQCSDCTQKHFKSNPASNNTNNTSNTSNTNNTTNTNNINTNSTASWSEAPSSVQLPPALPPVLSPQVSPARVTSDQMEEDSPKDGIDPNIPDASDWTSEQVYQYFARLFPKEAEIFRHQVHVA